jgi:protein-S-isoprenylcysteine O-methyltransferase Ste14
MQRSIGFLAPVVIISAILLLNATLPGRWVTGYINRPASAEKMRYHLNGFSVFIVIITLWFIFGNSGLIPYDFLYIHRWQGVTGACILGIVFTMAVVLPFPRVRRSLLADLYLGRAENLQLGDGRVDAKMWLYLTGATMLELNALSFAAHHMLIFGDKASPGILVSTALITFFVLDYLTFERVHLYTYDLFAERVGFKLGWGCLVFYPYFYPVALWSTVNRSDPHTPVWLMAIYVIVFFTGWTLARGANMQKYFFKRNPGKKFLWIVPETITNGTSTLLVNGFWGVSRHINYLGEILMASGIVLSAGYPALIWPWLYPLYYVLLLFPRQRDDDRRCAVKYGELWNEYKKRVPWKIIPHVY